MENLSQARAAELQRRMVDEGIDLLLLTDPDSIYYVSDYWGDLGVEFGRPSILAVPRAGDLTLITAFMESEMAGAMTWVTDIRPYKDGEGGEWADPLGDLIAGRDAATIAVECFQIPAMVSEYLREALGRADFTDGTDVLADMRMIKTPREIEMIRQAGRVAVAMGQAGRDAVGEGVPEFEVSLACIAGGTRMAAEIIGSEDAASLMSPMTHMHPTVRKLERFDPIYLCFCPIAHFKQFKLGFDREYFVGDIRDEQARLYETSLAAQRAGIDAMRPGVTAEEVHRASEAVYLDAGLDMSYRTGRAIGYSSLEKPQIKHGDKTVLQPGMAFAVDGGITIPGEFGARVGDTILVTETGTECVTEFPRDEMVV